MTKLILVFATVLMTVSGFAQKTADIGIWGGTSNYFGDIRGVQHFSSFNPNLGAYFRYNFNARVGLRAMFMTGKFAAVGEIENVPANFDKNVQDISLQMEINYLKYILGVKNTPFTSYIMAGVGVAYYSYNLNVETIGNIALFNPLHNKGNFENTESLVAPTIPFGIGFKFNLGERLGIGAEYQMRKTFNDKLDDYNDPFAYTDGPDGNEVTYTDAIHNNDWMGYLGIHLTYKIYIGEKACPAYESKN